MGATESTPTSPSPKPPPASAALPSLPPSHPLQVFLTATPLTTLPSDPDATFWTHLFLSYRHTNYPTLRTTPLISTLRSPTHPPPPLLAHTLRAATFRLRLYHAATAPSTDCPYTPAEVAAALHLVYALLNQLCSASHPHAVARLFYLVGATESDAHIPKEDRLDIGRALLAHLLHATIDVLTFPSAQTKGNRPIIPPQPHVDVCIAAARLVQLALVDTLHKPRDPNQNPQQQHQQHQPSALLDLYHSPSNLILSLLTTIVTISPHTTPTTFLENGCLPPTSANPSTANSILNRVPFPPNSNPLSLAASGASALANARIPSAFAALAASASASALNFHAGFNDAISAISARFSPPTQNTVPNIQVPDLDTETYSHIAAFPKQQQQSDPTTSAYPPNSPSSQPQPANKQSHQQQPAQTTATVDGAVRDSRQQLQLAEHVLSLLLLLCAPREGKRNSPFRDALFAMQDLPKRGSDIHPSSFSFSHLYDALGHWVTHPKAALLAYYLITGNRRFRTFALSRTDPDVLLIPLLASMRRRCVLGSTVADAYIPAAITLILTSDKGFCEAIDMITVPNSWLTFIEGKSRLGNEPISLSGVVLLVCARVIQQSLVLRRRTPECFLVNVCLAIMANVSGDVTNLHSLAAERLLSLVEFLARRRKKALLVAKHSKEMPMEPPRIGDSPRVRPQQSPTVDNGQVVNSDIYSTATAKVSSFEKSMAFLERLSSFIGMSLEIIVSVLRSRSVVSANRHLVYTLLHREAILDMDQVTNASVKSASLSHMLRRMIDFFGKYIDENGETSKEGGSVRNVDANASATGISVERVFSIIDKNARHLTPDVFEGVPELRFQYEELDGSEEFIRPYVWALAARQCESEWNLDQATIPVRNPKLRPSK